MTTDDFDAAMKRVMHMLEELAPDQREPFELFLGYLSCTLQSYCDEDRRSRRTIRRLRRELAEARREPRLLLLNHGAPPRLHPRVLAECEDLLYGGQRGLPADGIAALLRRK